MRLLEYPDAILCALESHDLNWNCHKDISEIDLRPIKGLAAVELNRRGVAVAAEA